MSRGLGPFLGVVGLLVGVLVAVAPRPAAAATSGPLTWSAPAQIEHQAPYGVAIGPSQLSCPSTSLCVGSGAGVFTSTDPAGAETWSLPVSVGPNGLGPISCPSTSLCVAIVGSSVVTSTNPTGGAGAWSAPVDVDDQGGLVTISCPSTSLCVASDSLGNVLTSTDPTGGAGAWSAPVAVVPQQPGGLTLNYLASISCPSTSLCVAVEGVVGGVNPVGNVLTSTDPTGGAGAWSAPVQVDGSLLSSISCPSTSLCVAASGFSGNVVTSTDPTGGAGAWSAPVVIDTATDTTAEVSCPSTSVCVVGDEQGNLMTSTDPTGGAGGWSAPVNIGGANGISAISCPSILLCVAVSSDGYAVSSTNPSGGASTWSARLPAGGTNTLHGTCPATSLCVAVDNAGSVMTSTDPAGGASTWSAPARVDGTNDLVDVSCVSTSLCAAVDSAGNVVTSTNPTGGAAAWKVPAHIDANGLARISCPSTSLCVAFDSSGNLVTSTNPTGGAGAWSAPVQINAGFTAISCPSTSLCVAVGNVTVATSTNPTGGVSAWPGAPNRLPVINDPNLLSGISCPSTTLCVAVDDGSLSTTTNVVTSTDPTGGAAAWSAPANIDPGTSRVNEPALYSVSCPSTSFCAAVDSNGNVLTSTNPTGGAAAWSAPAPIDAAGSLTGRVSCPSPSLCVAFDTGGNVVVGAATPVPDAAQVVVPSNAATLSGTALLDGGATNTSAVTSFQYELTGGSYTNRVVATAKPTFFGWLAEEANGTVGWDSTSVPSGTYTLTAVATYIDGTVVASPGVNITVSNPPPTSQVLIPSAGATVSGTTFLDGTASYTPNITQFTYDLDGAPVGNAVASPWGWLLLNWNTTTVANGSHTLTAVATYSDGAAATSPGITVTIANP